MHASSLNLAFHSKERRFKVISFVPGISAFLMLRIKKCFHVCMPLECKFYT